MPFYFRKECPLNSGYLKDLERQVRFLETRLMYLKKLKALAHPTKK
ncbi:putative transposase [Shigella flexneri 2a str. 2457T]|nr:putative transposase [Shigella flexneri 2a str. 2457T]